MCSTLAMPHLIARSSLALLVIAGCGARTGVEVPPPPDANIDAYVVPPPDATVDAFRVPRPDANLDAFNPVVPEIIVRVTADNSYRFGFGDARTLRDVRGAAEATTACEIFCCSPACTTSSQCDGFPCGPEGVCEDGLGPEVYRIAEGRATAEDFLYVVAWSDNSVTQGVLGEIETRDRLVRTGDEGWSVCATGQDFDTGSGGPSEADLTRWLSRCNVGDSPSRGWVGVTRSGSGLAVGETNRGELGDFPETCITPGHGDHISPEARWMWFDRDTAAGGDPFFELQPEFLIFRLATTALLGE